MIASKKGKSFLIGVLGGRVNGAKLTRLVGVVQDPAIARQEADSETTRCCDQEAVERIGKRRRRDSARISGNSGRELRHSHARPLESVTYPFFRRQRKAEAAGRVQCGYLEHGDNRDAEIQFRNRTGEHPAGATTEPSRFVFDAPEPDVGVEQHPLLPS